jgi:Holliday junction resolvasome RuvABC endonuclease subunit
VGLDLSLTATGVAALDDTATPALQTNTIKSKGKKDDTLLARGARLRTLSHNIIAITGKADIVIVEQPAFSQTGGSHHDRSGLWWLTVNKLQTAGIVVVEIPPTSLKKYITGKGNASKMEVVAKIIRLLPDTEVNNDNEADAIGLALMGARHYQTAVEETLPKVNLEAMDKIRWA